MIRMLPAALAAVLVSCGAPADTAQAPEAPEDPFAAARTCRESLPCEIVDTETLRTVWTTLLTEHAYLVALRAWAAAGAGDAAAADAVLDENAVELSDALGDAYGYAIQVGFLAIWREQNDLFVDYAAARRAGDAAEADAIRARLDRFEEDFVDLWAAVNPYLDQATIRSEIDLLTDSAMAIIDDQLVNDTGWYLESRYMAYRSARMAGRIAVAIDDQDPARYAGDAADGASVVAAYEAKMWTEHFYLAVIASQAQFVYGDYKAAKTVLDANSIDIGDEFGRVYGATFRYDWIWNWRYLINGYATYFRGSDLGDSTATRNGLSAMERYEADAVTLLTGKCPYIDRAELEATLDAHFDGLVAISDLQASGDAGWYTLAKDQADVAADNGLIVAAGLTQQFPGRYFTSP